MASPDVWIPAWHDPLASLTLSSSECLALGSFGPDSVAQLAVACDDAKLRMIRDTQVTDARKLAGEPVAACAVRPMGVASAASCIAVASGTSVFVYRNLRPFFKFSLPQLPVHPQEMALWDAVAKEEMSTDKAAKFASALRDDGGSLSDAASRLAAAADGTSGEDTDTIVEEQLALGPAKRHDLVTALSAVACEAQASGTLGRSTLAVGTESGSVLVLARDGVRVEDTIRLGSAPFRIRSWGSQAGDLRLAVLCRNGAVFMIKNGRVTTRILPALPPADVALSQSVVITVSAEPFSTAAQAALEGPAPHAAASAGMAEGFNPRNGIRLWTLALEAAPLSACSMGDAHPGAVAVALSNGGLIVVKDGACVSRSVVAPADDKVVGLQFGKYGREADTLVAVLASGALAVRILRRSARLDGSSAGSASAEDSAAPPLPMPKRTRLHLSHVQRERDNAGSLYRTFSRDVRTLSLRVKRAYVQLLASGADTTTASGRSSGSSRPQARLDADVHGVGPSFRVLVRLSLAARERSSLAGAVLEVVDETGDYAVETGLVPVPTVAPGSTVTFPVAVRWAAEVPAVGRLRLTLMRGKDETPLLVARAMLPPSEFDDL